MPRQLECHRVRPLRCLVLVSQCCVVLLLANLLASSGGAHQAPSSNRKELSLIGRPVCAHAFRQLLGIGAGRFRRLRRCALTDEPLPVDGRCRPRGHDSSNPDASRRRGLVVDFLEEIYQSMSEPMPEADKQFRPDQDHPDYVMPKMRFRRNRGKNPGKRSRDKALQREKLQDKPVRLLPPGTLTEYLGMLQAKYPAEKFSLKLLCSAPCLASTRQYFFLHVAIV